jgi:hypothetical protein
VRISDSLLRDDIARCLAGSPDKRWSSAGELATRLRNLPERRAAEARRLAELAARERAAHRHKLIRRGVAAVAMVFLFTALAFLAWRQSHKAKLAGAEDAIRQAAGLRQTDFTGGRKARGMLLINTAAANAADRPAVRTASAAVFALADLVKIAPGKTKTSAAPAAEPAHRTQVIGTNETCRAVSHSGLWTAVARDVDGLNGAVDVVEAATGSRLSCIERKQFPWVPVPDSGLLSFSPDDKLLAIGGPATSRHILLCNLPDGTLNSYLFHGSDPLCCAWHGGGRFLAIGCADGTIRIWDTKAASVPTLVQGNRFDVPPALDVPAQDQPIHVLRGHRAAVRHLAFASRGEWLAALDEAGYLRIHTGFPRTAPPRIGDVTTELRLPSPVFAVEVRLAEINHVSGLQSEADRVSVRRGALPAEEFQFVPSEFPAELPIAPGLTEIAFNAQGTELCATTPTDVYWLHTSPLDLLQTAAGENPMGASGLNQEDGWLIARDHQLTGWQPATDGTGSDKKIVGQFRLSEAESGQGSRTALASDAADRVAAYCGRRIQFFQHLRPAAPASSLLANGGGGVFRQIFWDRPGRLLGVVFELSNGALRLEAWQTSTNFPPQCQALPAAMLDCQWIIPANDGRHCIARAAVRGLYRFDPAQAKETLLDTSSVARQNAPLTCAHDGSLLAIVADRNTVRLLALPTGKLFADLYSPRQTDLTALAWDTSNRHLAAATGDGYVQVWSLGPWQEWLGRRGLQK